MSALNDSPISENIRVFLRQRPETSHELETPENGQQDASEAKLILDKSGRCIYEPSVKNSGSSERVLQEYKYKFNACYDHSSTQEDVYFGSAREIIQSSLKGYSGTIFAYGPTNSGKTYTMRGGGVGFDGQKGNFNKGLMERAVEELLSNLTSTGGELWASYLQIYCEIVNDLLHDPNDNEYTPPATAVGGGGKAAIAALKGVQREDSAQVELLLREKDGKVYAEELNDAKYVV